MTSKLQILAMLLIFLPLCFSKAPDWVAKGVSLEYSVGSSKATFVVTDRNSTDIRLDITTVKTNKATENASLQYGQFWFDDSLLGGASVGKKIGDFEVKAIGSMTFAGKEWSAITLEGTISDAKTTRIYDKQSGLMLKQTVNAEGAPTITLTKFTIPAFESAAPPPPAAPAEEENETVSGTDGDGVDESPAAPSSNDSASAPPSQPSTPSGPSTPPEEPEKKKYCLSGAMMLFLLAAVAFIRH